MPVAVGPPAVLLGDRHGLSEHLDRGPGIFPLDDLLKLAEVALPGAASKPDVGADGPVVRGRFGLPVKVADVERDDQAGLEQGLSRAGVFVLPYVPKSGDLQAAVVLDLSAVGRPGAHDD